jgi:hypothetical protein
MPIIGEIRDFTRAFGGAPTFTLRCAEALWGIHFPAIMRNSTVCV